MPQQFRNPLTRFLWTLDGGLSSLVFDCWDAAKRWGSAYSSFVYRFRLSGVRRIVVDLVDDAATFTVLLAFALLAYALPPFSGTGDVWNRGREYAITFTDANGQVIGRRGIRQDDAIPLDQIPPHMVKALLATEDARFYDHHGVDVIGTLRAIIHNSKSDSKQGGSSLTQQLAKNLFLSPERTIRRKVHEAFLAMWIEARLSKQQILKLYLDRSYMGGGNYGVEAAAQYYFGKSVRDITLPEAAMLAGLFKAPSKYAPHNNLDIARARANVVLQRMLAAGFITNGELLQAQREPATAIRQTATDSPDWFLDKAFRDTVALLDAKHITGNFVLEVRTTIDTKLQSATQKVISDEIAAQGDLYHLTQASAITMTPDGAIRALVGGNDYEASQFNRATDALRQTGSSFKPFVYLTALLHGFKPSDIVLDAPVSVGNWAPKNYGGSYAGRTTLTYALAHSLNSVTVRLMLAVGRKAIIETAHQAGIRGRLETWAPMVLGTSALTLLDLTGAYSTFANAGKVSDPYTVLEIRKPNGEALYRRADDLTVGAQQALPEEKIAQLNSMLKEVVKSGTARSADLGFTPQAGKTGTNQSYRDAWFVGFTAHNVTGVWVGNDDFTAMNKVTGGLVPAAMWKSIMMVAEAGTEPAALAGIPLDASYLKVPVPSEPTPVATLVTPALASAADETGLPVAETTSADAGSSDVLNSLVSLFDSPAPQIVAQQLQQQQQQSQQLAPPQSQQLAAPKPATVKAQRRALVLPKASTRSRRLAPKPSIFDMIFGLNRSANQQPRKQRTVFGF